MPWNSTGGRVFRVFAVSLLLSFVLSAQTQPVPSQSAAPNPTPQIPPPRAPFIMIDAAHGGSESGAIFGAGILEKDITLACARRLRQELMVRGFQAQVIRDGDFALSTDQRAAMVNSARPALYICMHAASLGSGIRVYSAVLPSGADDAGPFKNWAAVQTPALPRSRAIQQQLTAAIQKMGFPVQSLFAPLRPLNNVAAPAIAIEIAPANGSAMQLASADYQQMTSAALASAISTLRAKLEAP